MRSTRELFLACAAAAGLALGGCGEAADDHDHGGAGESHEHGPDGTEGEAHEEAGGDHAHEHDAAGKRDLGSATVGAYTVRAAHYGAITPGEESDVDISVAGGEGAPAAVRAWIGLEDGSGSMKAKAEPEGANFHAHVEAPDPLPQDARLWVEIETAGGETLAGSFGLGG
ncbi:MAG TPA: hypothetical protein VFF69_09495 [Phycisphaerales bacterium]|nr:hypothetical protein [Phycisphaerales bacterium]